MPLDFCGIYLENNENAKNTSRKCFMLPPENVLHNLHKLLDMQKWVYAGEKTHTHTHTFTVMS